MKKSTLLNNIANNGPLIRLILQSTTVNSTFERKTVEIKPDNGISSLDELDFLPTYCTVVEKEIKISGITLEDLINTINSARNVLIAFIKEKQKEISIIETEINKRKHLFANIEVPNYEVSSRCYDDARHICTIYNYVKSNYQNATKQKQAA